MSKKEGSVVKNKTRLLILCALFVVIVVSVVIVVTQNSEKKDGADTSVRSDSAGIIASGTESTIAEETGSEVAGTETVGTGLFGADSYGTDGIETDGFGLTAAGIENASEGPAELAGPVTATLTFKVNSALLPTIGALAESFYSGASDLITAAAAIGENTTVEGIWDGPSAQLNVLLKGQQIVYAALHSDGNTITVVSDALPNASAVQTTANQLLGYYGDRQLNLNFTPADLALLEDAVKSLASKIDSEIAVRTDDAESGSWTFEGKTFTLRRRISATPREIGVIAIKAFRDALKDPKITALIDRIGVELYTDSLDYQIERMESDSEDYYPTLEAYRYSNGEGDTFTDGKLTTYNSHYSYNHETGEESYSREPGAVLAIYYGIVDRNLVAYFSAVGNDSELSLKADTHGYHYDFTANLSNVTQVRGISISGKVHASGKTAQSGEREGSLDIQVLNMDLLTLNYEIRQGGSVTASFDTTGKTLYPFSEVTNSSFLRNLRLGDIAGKVMNIMPEEASKLVTLARQLLNW